jgi:hypothetical protein
MKKLVLFFAAVLLTAISSNLFAQATGINPDLGGTFTYTVNNHTGSTYAWAVYDNAAGTGTDLLGAGSVVSGNSTTNSINLTWHASSIGNTYYVHVIETDANSCTNHKVLAVEPKNQFEMDIANVDNTGAGLPVDHSTCAPDITNISWNGATPVTSGNATNFSYDYGIVTFYYNVTATGITGTDWVPVFVINQNSTGTVTAEWCTTINGTYTTGLNTDGTTNNSFTVSGSNEFFVKVIVNLGTADEGLVARDIKINLDETLSKDEFNNQVTNTNTGTIDQIIDARPDSGAISY